MRGNPILMGGYRRKTSSMQACRYLSIEHDCRLMSLGDLKADRISAFSFALTSGYWVR